MTGRVLIIGYGNTLCGDDAVGQIAALRLADDAAIAGLEVIACHQLVPELAQRIAASDLTVFIDAATDLPAGAVVVRPVRAVPLSSSMMHHVDPRRLLFLAAELYGREPDARSVGVGAATFALGDGLSAPVDAALPEVLATVRRLLDQARTASSSVPSASSNWISTGY